MALPPAITTDLLFFAGLVLTFSMDENRSLLLISLMFLSLSIGYVLSTKMSMMPRYLIYLMPVYFLGIAASYEGFYSIVKDRKTVYFLLILIIVVSLPYFSGYHSGFQKNDWRGFSGILQQVTLEDDVVVVLPGYIMQSLDYFYDSEKDLTSEYAASSSSQLQEIKSQKRVTRYFMWYRRHFCGKS